MNPTDVEQASARAATSVALHRRGLVVALTTPTRMPPLCLMQSVGVRVLDLMLGRLLTIPRSRLTESSNLPTYSQSHQKTLWASDNAEHTLM